MTCCAKRLAGLALASALACASAARAPGAIRIDDPEDLADAPTRARLEREARTTVGLVCAHWSLEPPAHPIPVRITSGGEHCHAGRDGILLQREHVELADLSHELVHYLCGDTWRALSEGLAMHYTQRCASDAADPEYVPLDQRARAWIATGHMADLSAAACEEGMDPATYDQAGSFVAFLLERFGPRRVRALYDGPPDGYEQALGRALDDLLDDWRAALVRRVPEDDERFARFQAEIHANHSRDDMR